MHTTIMSINRLQKFLEKNFPQVSQDFKIISLNKGEIKVEMLISEKHLRPGKTVSGPSIFLLADVTFYLATLSVIGPKALSVTSNANINFMRKPPFGNVFANARILKIGKNLIVGDVLVHSSDIEKAVAHASMTYSIPPSFENDDN